MSIKICFVCLGNICRSPMAEFIAKDKINKQKLDWFITSAGTSGYHDGEGMHPGTHNILESNSISHKPFVSKKINNDIVHECDYIIVMDDQNLSDLKRLFPNSNSKISKITDYGNLGYNNVPDPWYTKNFNEVYTILNDAISNLIFDLKAKK